VKVSELEVRLLRGFVEVNLTGPAQDVSPGPYTLKVTDPVGVGADPGGAPNVAVSVNESPTVKVADETCVEIGRTGAAVTVAVTAVAV